MKKNRINSNGHDRKCVVCGEPAFFFTSDSEYLCLRVACKQLLDKKTHMSEGAYNQCVSLHSAMIKRVIRQSKLRKKKREEKRKKEDKENIAYWMRTIKQGFADDLEQYPYTVISTNPEKIVKLPQRRKKLFREFLSELINRTMSEIEGGYDNIIDYENEALNRYEAEDNRFPIEKKACSICGGSCCSAGREHAFLKRETILRCVTVGSVQKPEDVLAEYMKYLPENTFKDSCVYHTETGCSLPRNMRSHVCNDGLCCSLRKLRRLFSREVVPKGVLFISRVHGDSNRLDPDADNSIVSSELVLRSYAGKLLSGKSSF
jgi:hypothetical protein